MLFSELKKSLTNGVMPIYQIFGKDAFLKENALRLLKEGFLTEPDLNLSNFTGAELKESFDGVLSAMQSYPFMGDKRFIVVRDYYPTKKEISSKVVKSLFEEVYDTSVLIIINEEESKEISSFERVTKVDCNRTSDDVIFRYIQSKCYKFNITISKEACYKLIEYTFGDMAKINGEVDKLIAYVGDNGKISQNDVELVVFKDIEHDVYKLIRFIATKDKEKAISMLKEMLLKSKDEHLVFSRLLYHFRVLLYTSISKCSDFEVSKLLGVQQFVVTNAKAQLKLFTPKRLKEIYDKLLKYDTSFKSGVCDVSSALWINVFNAII